MANGETEKQEMGAPKLDPTLEQKIRYEVETEFPYLTPAEKDIMIESRLKIATPGSRPKLTKIDLGDNASPIDSL